MLGSTIVTHQTGPEGLPVNTVLVEAGSRIARELYLSLLVDRAQERVVFMASAAGGVNASFPRKPAAAISAAFFSNYLILTFGQSDAGWASAFHLDDWAWRWMLGAETLPASDQ